MDQLCSITRGCSAGQRLSRRRLPSCRVCRPKGTLPIHVLSCRLLTDITCLPGSARHRYWALVTMTTVGHVDLIDRESDRLTGAAWELGVAVGVALAASLVYIYVTANFTSMVLRGQQSLEQYRTRVENIDAYLRRNHVRPSLRRLVRQHFKQSYESSGMNDDLLLQQMPVWLASPACQPGLLLQQICVWLLCQPCTPALPLPSFPALSYPLWPAFVAPAHAATRDHDRHQHEDDPPRTCLPGLRQGNGGLGVLPALSRELPERRTHHQAGAQPY